MKKSLPVEFVKSASHPRDFPTDAEPEIAFVGRSNVGKSTLLNQLAGTKRMAFVSKTPGRTQLVNFFRRAGEWMLVDLPGYGFAKAPRSVRENWEALITGYLFDRPTLCLVLLLVDLRREPMESDLEVRDLLVKAEIPYAVVATKADKLGKNRAHAQRRKLQRVYGPTEEVPFITFSSVTNEGRKELWKVIETHSRASRRAPKK